MITPDILLAMSLAQQIQPRVERRANYHQSAYSDEAYIIDQRLAGAASSAIMTVRGSSVILRVSPIPLNISDASDNWFGDELDKLLSQVPEEVWEKVPSDLSSRVDEYLYG